MSEIKNANGRPAWLRVNAIAKYEALVSMSNLTDSSKLYTTDYSIFFFLTLKASAISGVYGNIFIATRG